MVGNPIPRPYTASNFGTFSADFISEEGRKLKTSKFHRNKFPEYSMLLWQCSFLYDIVVRQFTALHSVGICDSICASLAFNTLGIVKLFKEAWARKGDIE